MAQGGSHIWVKTKGMGMRKDGGKYKERKSREGDADEKW